MRRMPGRIAGETTDVDGKRGFVLTLQTREQHIRRERATSNICTSQALNALAGVIYLSWLGRRGIVELAELMLQRTAYARERLSAIEGVALLHEQPGGPRVRARARRAGGAGDRALPRGGRERRLSARARLSRASRTGCSSRSPSGARRRTSTGWRRCSAPPSRPSGRPPERAHDPRRRRRADDLPALTRGAARVRRTVAGRARAAARRAASRSPATRTRGHGCPRSPSPRSCGTSTGCRSATSIWTPASTRSARAR